MSNPRAVLGYSDLNPGENIESLWEWTNIMSKQSPLSMYLLNVSMSDIYMVETMVSK